MMLPLRLVGLLLSATAARPRRRVPAPGPRWGDLAQPDEAPVSPSWGREKPDARLRLMIDSAVDAFVAVDADGTILEWNREAELLFGWTRNDVVGRHLVLVPNQPGPGDEGPFTGLAPDGESVRQRLLMPAVHRDGHAVPVELTLWSAGHGDSRSYNVFFRRLAGDAGDLEALMCRVGSIVESSDAAITSEGLDGRILTWNRAAVEAFGHTAAEAIGQPASLVVPAHLREEVRRLYDGARQGTPVANHETVRLRKDGSLVDVAVTISPVYDALGRVVGVSTIARDISEQRRIAADLENALEDARQAEVQSREFLADAAHQLRNPVAGVRACADALMRTSSTDGRERLLTQILKEAARAGHLVNSLLRMAHLDRGEARVLRPCDLVALCHGEVERARVLAPHLDVVVRADERLAEHLLLDADAVSEILSNLLDNARRFAAGRMELLVRQPDAGMAEVRVSDDGPGLAPDKVEAAFKRFVSLDGKGGSGLGLPIARGLARAHGGDLTYEAGTFVLRLPAPSAS